MYEKGSAIGRDRIVPVIAYVRSAWHDAAAYLCYLVMVLRQATGNCVTSAEGHIPIASLSSYRPGPDARGHATSGIEMQREPRSRVTVY